MEFVGRHVRNPTGFTSLEQNDAVSFEAHSEELLPASAANSTAHISKTNEFGFNEAVLRFNVNASDHWPEAYQQHVEELQLEISVLSEKGWYLSPLGQCPICPSAPFKESLLDVGVQDDVMDGIDRRLASGTDAAQELSKRFESKVPLFTNWKRMHMLCDGAARPFAVAQPPAAAAKSPLSDGAPNEDLQSTQRTVAGLSSQSSGVVQQLTKNMTTRPSALPTHVYYQPFTPRFVRGALHDTYFLLAVGAVASHQRIFSSLFESLEYLHRGAATFRFFATDSNTKEQASTLVTIDTLIPVTASQRPHAPPKDMDVVFGKTTVPEECWLVLLEKAYATFRGSYAALNEGCTVEALLHLTGGSPYTVAWPARTQTTSPVLSVEVDDLWWFLRETTLHGDLAVAYNKASESSGLDTPKMRFNAPLDTAHVDWDDAIVILFVVEYDSTVEIPQDIYARLSGKPTKRGEVHRLIKVRSAFDRQVRRRDGTEWSWAEPSSVRWTPQASQFLGRTADAEKTAAEDSVTWWITEEELLTYYTNVTAVINIPSSATGVLTTPHAFQPVTSINELPLHVPHIGLHVTREVASHRGAQADALGAPRRSTIGAADLPHQFRSLQQVEVPPIDFGDESEDDEDGGSGGKGPLTTEAVSPRNAMSSSFSSCEVQLRSKNVASLEIRVALPPSEHRKRFTLMLYRTGSAAKVEHPTSIIDGQCVHQLAVQGRVAWKHTLSVVDVDPYAPVFPFTNVSNAQVSSYVAEAEVSEGYYNLVIYPDVLASGVEDAISVRGPIRVSIYHVPCGGGATTSSTSLHVTLKPL